MSIDDPYAALRERVFANVLDGPGESDAAVRRAAAEGVGATAELQRLVDKIERHAHRITDEDIASLQRVHGDDALFEIVVSAAIGASRRRLEAGLRALEEA